MLRPYGDLLAIPGVRRFSAAAFVARMPMAMMTLGIVLLVAESTGAYGSAGAVAGTYAAVSAATGPLLARLVDRFGQRRVVVPSVAIHSVFLLSFIAAVSVGTPLWTWFPLAAAAGAAAPPIGSLLRARWGHVLGPGPRLQTAYSLESVFDELIFVVGPIIITLLATRGDPRLALVVTLGLLVSGATLFVRDHRSEPPPNAHHNHARGSVLRVAGMAYLVLAMVFIGGVFGGVEISTVAFADQDERPALAGPLLACYAFGSMLSGLIYGTISWRVSLVRRLALGTAVMTATVSVLPLVAEPAVLAPLLFLAGVGIAPTLISCLSLVQQMVPVTRVTEGLTWATTAIVIGMSIASTVAGRLVDTAGAAAAFTVALVAGGAAVLTCLIGYRRIQPDVRPAAPVGGGQSVRP